MITKKNTKHSKKLRYIVIVGVILLIIFVISVYALIDHSSTNSPTPKPTVKTPSVINTAPPTTEQVDSTNSTKQTNANNTSNQQSGANTPSDTINIQSLTSYYQNQGSSKNILTSVIISNSINTGTCTLTLSKGSVTKSYTADIQFNGTYSTCKGFTTPITDLGSGYVGTWNVGVNVVSGSATGQASTTVTVN